MAFTTSDNFTYVDVGLYDFYPGELIARAINTNGDTFRLYFGQGRTPNA